MSDKKVCIGCNIEKVASTEFFHANKGCRDGLNGRCKDCVKEYQQSRKEKTRQNARLWREKNRDKINENARLWREDNRERTKEIARDYYHRHRSEIIEKYSTIEFKDYQKQWIENNHEKVKAYKRKWNKNNREQLNTWEKNRRASDPCFRLRKNVSRAISLALNGDKEGSIFEHLTWNTNDLREHLERQFDEHMNWENYGTYWHIDHIYPQSLLPYDSMEHPNFLRCWSLDNLQPLEATENIRKSNKIL